MRAISYTPHRIRHAFLRQKSTALRMSNGALVLLNVHNFIYCLDRIKWILLPCLPFPDERLNGNPPAAERKEQSEGSLTALIIFNIQIFIK